MGRIVITHSTYIEGLVDRLKMLAKDKDIQTITPGKISKAKGRRELLEIKVTTKTKGGHKLIARRGNSVQEVFVITQLDKESLCDKLASKVN